MTQLKKTSIKTITYALILMLLTATLSQLPFFKAHASPKMPSPDAAVKAKTTPVANFSSPDAFAKTLKPYAEKVGKKHNVDPKILIAQAAHESNWGRSIPKGAKGQSSHNLFGIKGNYGSKNTAKAKTKEHIKGKTVTHYGFFRLYFDYGECFEHYIQIMHAKRYNNILKHGQNPKAYFEQLQKSGYATDPQYAKKLLRVYHHPSIKKLG